MDVRVFDTRGRLVRTLTSRRALTPGIHELRWDGLNEGGTPAATGIYYIRVLAGAEAAVSRAVLLR